jgi:prevent-host-death family protein
MEVGVRELRDHLSRYLDKVRAGEELVVTERGQAVARIISAGAVGTFDRLVAEGLVTPAPPRSRTRPHKRTRAEGSVASLVADQRR